MLLIPLQPQNGIQPMAAPESASPFGPVVSFQTVLQNLQQKQPSVEPAPAIPDMLAEDNHPSLATLMATILNDSRIKNLVRVEKPISDSDETWMPVFPSSGALSESE